MKLPSLGWNKIVAGGRSVWNVTSSAGGLVKSKRALVAAATLGVGTLTSSAGYLVWQGRSSDPQTEVADANSPETPASVDGADATAIIPIREGDVPNEGDSGNVPADSGGRFGSSPTLLPPPASAFRNGLRGTENTNEPGGAGHGDPGLGNPTAEEGAESVDPQAAVAGMGDAPVDDQGALEPPADQGIEGRPRILAVGEGPIRQAGADDAGAETPGVMNQDPAATGEPGVEGSPGENGTPGGPSEPADGRGLQPVPRVGDTGEQVGGVAGQPEPSAAPAPPPPMPDRIVIPSDPPESLRSNAVGGSNPSRFGSSPPGTDRPTQPSSRFGGVPSLAPVPGAAVGAALGAAGTAGGAGASLGGAAMGGAAGAVGGAGIVGLGSALADDGPTISRPTPGAKELEGTQTPSLTLEKLAPAEIQVGKPAVFQIKVRNVGRVAAHGVVISDHVPDGTKLLDADPEFVRGADGIVRWQLGTLAPNQEVVLAMKLLPEQEGEIGSVAQVSFQSQASVRTVCTRPQITLQHQTQQKVMIGDDVILAITIANNGTGAATGLVIEEVVPQGLAHPVDKELEYQVGTLRPGESRRLELTLKAAKAGIVENILVARSDETVMAEDRLQLEVVAPQLKVGLTGPKVRYLDRQAIYSVSVANPGTASGKNVELAAHLPRGLKFVGAENQGQYDAKLHAVFWGLADLPVGATGAAQLTVIPIEPGPQAIRVTGQGDLGIQDELQQTVVVESLSELQFSVADVADPIEVGSDTTYDVRITNRGTRAATNVQLIIEFPAELQPIGGEGPSRVTVRGPQLVVEPLGRLAPDTEARYKIQARGLRPGDPRIRVQLVSAESPTPVTKEESTRVYADE